MTLSVLMLVLGRGQAYAHDPSLSGIRILFRTGKVADVVVNVTTHISRLTTAEATTTPTIKTNDPRTDPKAKPPLTQQQMDLAIRRRLKLRIDGVNFIVSPRTKIHLIVDPANDMLIWQAVRPGTAQDCDVLTRLYPEDPNSRTVVSVLRDGTPIRDAMLEATVPNDLAHQPTKSPISIAAQYLREGVLHILGGADHIAFVLGLLLLGGTLKSLLKTVTAFTLAHSITLTLAATGVWNPSPRIVEPLIALSIVAVAIENLRPINSKRTEKTTEPDSENNSITTPARPDRRPYYAFGFGLIHGFGFAGALAEVGLPLNALAAALASFNIGVEIGQAGIVLAVSPLIAWLSKHRPRIALWTLRIGSTAIAVAGAYWFVTRLSH